MRYINHLSDFQVVINITDKDGNIIAPPSVPWEAVFSDENCVEFKCYYDGTNYTHCIVDGNDIVCFVDNPGFSCGKLRCTFCQHVPSEEYCDGVMNLSQPLQCDIMLSKRESDDSTPITIEASPNWVRGPQGPQGEKGDKGDKGEQGIQGLQGLQGIQGEKGEKGDKGDTGSQGPIGLTGPQGIQGIQGIQGVQGEKGADGFSPIVSLTKQGTISTLSITDADGEHTTEIADGAKGDDGFSPIVSLNKVGKVTTLTITDAQGTHTATVNDGESVEVVQSTGNSTTSVMSQKAVSDYINRLKNAGYLYAGIATPTTNPGTPDGPVFYIASQAGTYSNFGNTEIDNTGIFTWDGISWSFEKLNFSGGSNIEIINDLTTGGEGNALSAEMGKVLAESCGVKKNVFTQTLGYNIFPANGDYPIMIAGKTYSIHIQGDKPMGQTKWELWGRTASGTARIRQFGSTDMSVEQVITYTPAADIYAIGCNYSSGVQDTTVMITYTIPYNDYTCVLRKDLQGFGDILEVGKIVVLDVTDIIEGKGNSTWYYEQSTPIMKSGCNYTIIVKSVDSYTPNRWELWGKNKSGTAIKINSFYSVDLSEGQSTVYTPTNDIYSLYCGNNTSSIDTKFEYKVVTDYSESQRLFGVEKSTTEINETLKKAEINVYSSYYKMGAAKNDTYNLVSRPIGLIVMGQSNADGRIPNSSFPATATIDTTDDLTLSKQLTHCLFMKGDQEDTYGEASKNFAARNNSGDWAFDDIVYNAVNQALGGETDFYAIKQTRGNTGIVDMAFPNFNANVDRCKESGMSKNSQLYHFKGLIERALELNPDINFKAILWHQGERECNSYKQGPYYEALCQMIYWLRGKVGNPKLPFIFGTVPTDSAQYSAIVKADMERVAQDINDCYLVDLGAAGDMIDRFHFGASTAERLAREMFKIMRQNYMLAPMINPL